MIGRQLFYIFMILFLSILEGVGYDCYEGGRWEGFKRRFHVDLDMKNYFMRGRGEKYPIYFAETREYLLNACSSVFDPDNVFDDHGNCFEGSKRGDGFCYGLKGDRKFFDYHGYQRCVVDYMKKLYVYGLEHEYLLRDMMDENMRDGDCVRSYYEIVGIRVRLSEWFGHMKFLMQDGVHGAYVGEMILALKDLRERMKEDLGLGN